MDDMKEELKLFAEALLDLDRLKIVGELARGHGSVDALAARAGLDPATVLAHLEVLSRTGVVALVDPRTYRIDEQKLEEMSRRQFARIQGQGDVDRRPIGAGFSPEQVKYIRSFTDPNGLIRHLPSIHAQAKLMAVLHYAMQDLEPGRIYTEAEFNQALSRFTRDASSVRRELVDWGFVDRKVDGSAYWLKEAVDG